MTSEFEIIKRYFSFSSLSNDSVIVGVGDDAAIINSHANRGDLVVATDTLVESVHFPKGMASQHIASRAMGVNLSDFAAMGVEPKWYTLSLTLPSSDTNWLESFSSELALLSAKYGVALVGGDTTRGPLSITLTVMGFSSALYRNTNPSIAALTRDAARAGDAIWVSGSLGKGAAALMLIENQSQGDESSLSDNADVVRWVLSRKDREDLLETYYAPVPHLSLGVALVGVAHAAIDISDGLLADAGHIAEQSKVCFMIDGQSLPVHKAVQRYPEEKTRQQWVLTGGDEYELLFTASQRTESMIQAIAAEHQIPCKKIGRVLEGSGVQLGGWPSPETTGYTHF